MDFIKKLINKINPGITKGVGVFISPDSTLEVVEYDYDLGEIINYEKLDFEYNSIRREIDTESFELALQTMLKKFEISQTTPATISIPSIFVNKKNLPSELEREELQTALVSETEKNYIFKKNEPSVSWNIINTDKATQENTILYTALQKNLVDKLDDIFKRQGLKLAAVDISYTSFIRGLSVTGLIDDCIEKDFNWCVLIVKNNTNAVITLQGSQIINIVENPLAINSIEPTELYQSLSQVLIEQVELPIVETLVIANFSNIVDVNTLSTYFNYNCPIIKINNNKHNEQTLFSFDTSISKNTNNTSDNLNIESINPEVIGAACWKNAPIKLGFNFLNSVGQDEQGGLFASLGLVGNPLHLILLGLIAVEFVIITFISLICLPINASLDDQYKKLYVQCSEYEAKFAAPQAKVFNLFDLVVNSYDDNKKIITSFDALSAVIPDKVWITSISMDEKLNVNIKGKAYAVKDIINYYENMQSVSKFNNMKILSINAVGEDNPIISPSPADVTINTMPGTTNPNNMPMQPGQPDMSGQPGMPGNSNLPPPPAQSGLSQTNPLPVIAGSKYYEFEFGNPIEEKPANATPNADQNSGKFIPGLSELSKNFNMGGKPPGQ